MLRGLRNFLDIDRPEHHSTDCLKEKGAAAFLPLKSGSTCVQPNIGAVSIATLGRLPTARMGFSEH